MNINWHIHRCTYDVATGGIKAVDWSAVANDGDYVGSVEGSVNLLPDPSEQNFIPYENVTKQAVLDWVWQTVSKDQTEAELERQIQNQKQPTEMVGIPWQKAI